MKVFIVEDERKMAAFLERAFREHGFEAEVRCQGGQAFDRMMEAAFDAVAGFTHLNGGGV
jgi:DNA-binding response OmpR family regulator